jgi:hypothetical protein
MARIPKRSPSSFSRWFSSTVSSFGPASSSVCFAFFNLPIVSSRTDGFSVGTYFWRLYSTLINPPRIVRTNSDKKTTLFKISLCNTRVLYFKTYMYLYANCKSPNQFDIMINSSRWRRVLLNDDFLVLDIFVCYALEV